MTRVTQKQIRDKVKWLNDRHGLNLYAEWSQGHTGVTPRIYDLDDSHRELSPRLPTGQMLTWLEAFEAGLEFGWKLRRKAE